MKNFVTCFINCAIGLAAWSGAAGVACHAQAIITTVAGTGVGGFSGDGGPAISAKLGLGFDGNLNVAVDNAGNLFIADVQNYRIRKVNAAGIITTVAGRGKDTVEPGDGGPATSAFISPDGVAVDGPGNIYIDEGLRIRKVNGAGIINTIAGNGTGDDGGPAVSAAIQCTSMAVDRAGNIYFAEMFRARIRKIDTAGIITTVAGNGTAGSSPDGTLAKNAMLTLPRIMAVDSAGNLYFVDNSYYIRKRDQRRPHEPETDSADRAED